MDQELLLFFDKTPEALHLYETFEERILSEIQGVRVRVQKTQITFSNRYNFACVSFLPVRKAKERPKVYITVTFGLGRKEESPRIDQSTEAYPGRWTHHVMVSKTQDIDEELIRWVKEAALFAEHKGVSKSIQKRRKG